MSVSRSRWTVRHLINAQVRLAYGETTTRHKRIADVSDSLIFLLYFCARRRDKELINLKQLLSVKVPVATPGRPRNALRVDNERKVILEAWQQAGHSMMSNSLHRPGRRFQVLQCLAASTLIDRLYRIVACVELLSRPLLPVSAVFFSSPASRSSYGCRCRNAA